MIGSMNRELRAGTRWAGPVTLALVVLGAVFLAVASLSFRGAPDPSGWAYDLKAYLAAAERLAHGVSIYPAETLAGPFHPGPSGLYYYAPPLAVSLLPLTGSPVAAVADIWLLLRLSLLVAACWMMPVRPRLRLLGFVVAVFASPVLIDINLGNVSIVLAFLSVAAWRWLDRPIGSLAMAAAISLRPTFGIFLVWWLVRRRWLPLAWALGGGFVLILITLPFVGLAGYADYVSVLRNLGGGSGATGLSNNADLASTLLRLGAPSVAATAALFGGSVLAIGATLFSLRRDAEVSFMVTLGATLLLSPVLWDHYLVSLLLPGAFLAQRGRPWALGLPLLAWLPTPFLPLLAIAATVLPLLAPSPSGDTYPAGLVPGPALPAGSKRTVLPA
jgi:hypothetical protein